jgi:hypothetical protein
MGVRLQRNLTSRGSLASGQYFTDVLKHQPGQMCTVYACCPSCGSIGAIPPGHVINIGGKVVPAWKCSNEACSFFEFVELEGWGEAVP